MKYDRSKLTWSCILLLRHFDVGIVSYSATTEKVTSRVRCKGIQDDESLVTSIIREIERRPTSEFIQSLLFNNAASAASL